MHSARQKSQTGKAAAARRALQMPDWRWRAAEALAARPFGDLDEAADAHVHEAAEFLRRGKTADAEMESTGTYSEIETARALEADEARAAELKILVLGGCPQEEIASRFGLTAEVIAAWERLFFDVRDRRDATSWIQLYVIHPEETRGNPELAAKLKVAVGGPEAARRVLESTSQISLEAGARLFDLKLRLHLKAEQALNMPHTSEREREAFLKSYFDFEAKLKKLELEEKKFEERCRQARRREALAEKRLELQRDREQQRSEERARCEEARQQGRRAAEERVTADGQKREAARQARAAGSPLAGLRWRPSAVAAEAGPGAPAESARRPASGGQSHIDPLELPVDDPTTGSPSASRGSRSAARCGEDHTKTGQQNGRPRKPAAA